MPHRLRTFVLLTAAFALSGACGNKGSGAAGQETAAGEPLKVGKKLEGSAPARPDWLTIAAPSDTRCKRFDDSSITCVGASSYRVELDAARTEASNAAYAAAVEHLRNELTELQGQIPIRVFGSARADMLAELRTASTAEGPDYDTALAKVRAARAAAAEGLRLTAGSLVPEKVRADYWETFESVGKGPPRHLAFAVVDLDESAVQQLLSFYSNGEPIYDSVFINLLPATAWRTPAVRSGAIVIRVDGLFARSKMPRYSVVTHVDGRQVHDAFSVAAAVNDAVRALEKKGGGAFTFTILESADSSAAAVRPLTIDVAGR